MNTLKVGELRRRSNSPFSPEPPRRSLVVDLAFRTLGARRLVTPHLSAGSNADKVAYEYNGADCFWSDIKPHFGPDDLRGKDVLDVGCGWGGKAIHFAEHCGVRSMSGFDLPGVFDAEAPNEVARVKGLTCTFKTGFAEAIPFDDKQFDVLLMEDVMEHVADPEKVLAECFRILRPGGRLVVKFPSFKSMRAHHLDRALGAPALHYMLPMKTWASGFNDLLLRAGDRITFEPFDEIVTTRFGKSVTRNLNGLDFDQFRRLVGNSKFVVRILTLVPFPATGGRQRAAKVAYRQLYKIPALREFLASFVLLVAERSGE